MPARFEKPRPRPPRAEPALYTLSVEEREVLAEGAQYVGSPHHTDVPKYGSPSSPRQGFVTIEEAEALEVAGDVEAALAVYRRIGATRAARRLEDALGVRRSAETRGDGGLSRREEQVAELLCQGLPYKDIGDRLGIGERTIETHAKAVYRKLGVKDRRELMTRRRPRAS